MRHHPLIGERICEPLATASEFSPIVRHHHERWDGAGYPDGLRGETDPDRRPDRRPRRCLRRDHPRPAVPAGTHRRGGARGAACAGGRPVRPGARPALRADHRAGAGGAPDPRHPGARGAPHSGLTYDLRHAPERRPGRRDSSPSSRSPWSTTCAIASARPARGRARLPVASTVVALGADRPRRVARPPVRSSGWRRSCRRCSTQPVLVPVARQLRPTRASARARRGGRGVPSG